MAHETGQGGRAVGLEFDSKGCGFALVVVVALVLVGGGVLLVQDLGGRADRAAVARANAEASLVRARADAYAVRAAADEARRENGHQRAIELLPFTVLVVGVVVLMAFGGFVVWDVVSLRRERMGAPAERLPPVTVLVLPVPGPGQSRAEYWRQVSHEASRTLGDGRGDGVSK